MTSTRRRLAVVHAHIIGQQQQHEVVVELETAAAAGIITWFKGLFGTESDDAMGSGTGGQTSSDVDVAADTVAPLELTAELLLDCKCQLGEGLFWDHEEQRVKFLDISGNKLYSLDHNSGDCVAWATPENPGTWAKCTTKEAGYIIAFATGFALFNPETGATTGCDMGEITINPANMGRLNDGRCDRQGRLVAGGYNDAGSRGEIKQSRCFQVDPTSLKVRQLLDFGICCANSTCFSPDGTTMYFADSPECKIWAFDYDVHTGDPSNQRTFIDFESRGLEGVPDGSTVDATGGLWSCNIGAGKVTRYDPISGAITCVVHVPNVSTPTCVAIGGAELDTLFITSLTRKGGHEHEGGLFHVKLPPQFRGLVEPSFAY